ncbi:DEAD/DEAH box helicase [Haladaptatus sp. YSMS36]|uniref:DEAD/DEAH box helicase n=1 Tax=Haladaptatus sp. YSMS36 TaxID=3033384 RepID=UPI0023E85D33|nr:DEAD/DEAH box helicase [Haladaptatus sp. YSMS36]
MAEDVRPLLIGLLENKQIFGPDQTDPPYVTSAVKYTKRPQKRRQPSTYSGDDEFTNSIIDIFGFQPLEFQVKSWNLIKNLDEQRRNSDKSLGAIFSAPTGFGKTEAFLGGLYQQLRENHQEMIILVYPSRALLQDQLGRILHHTHTIRESTGDNLTVGAWTGDIPYSRNDVASSKKLFTRHRGTSRFRLTNCWCGDDNESHSFVFSGGENGYKLTCENDPSHAFTDRELVLSREAIRRGSPPNILLTTLESLENFGLKPNYNIIQYADSIVFDEIHLNTGIRGAHAANIIKNIEAVTDDSLLWLGSSATVDDATRFASKIFPIQSDRIEHVEPGDADIVEDPDDAEHYYFLKSTEDGPGVTSMFIQHILLLAHGLLQEKNEPRGKMLSFIDSISQVNQKRTQLEDADHNRQLWQYHVGSNEEDDWRLVADEMGYEFIEDDIEFESVYSDRGFDGSATDSDVLLSTNFLEVGIDVGDITMVSQYRTPWNLSSFIQRVGRAARKPGTSSHIFVFLSDLTEDANMFYRADRFLDSEIRTPLKTDNEVVQWIHEQFRHFYEVASDVRSRGHLSKITDKQEIHQELLVDRLDWEDYHTLLVNPDAIISRELEIYDSFAPLTGKEPVTELIERLQEEQQQVQQQLEISGVDIKGGAGKAVEQSLAESIRENFLTFIHERIGLLSTCKKHDVPVADDVIDDLEEALDDLRKIVTDETTDQASVDTFLDLTPDLYMITANVKRASRAATDAGVDVGGFRFEAEDLDNQVAELNRRSDSDEMDDLAKKRDQIYYLLQALEEIRRYNKIETNHLSLYYVKYLLRGGYYFDRFLRVRGGSIGGEVWYFPENYFDDAGKYFTVFSGKHDSKGSEESIDKLVHSYTPLRSEYQQEAGHLQAFVPRTKVDEDGSVWFDFSEIAGDIHDDLLVPDSITLSDVDDLSGTKALNIVRYCPECLQILSEGSCLRHNVSKLGKIHANPQIETDLTNKSIEKSSVVVSLSDISGTVRLTGVSLDITPARYNATEDEYFFVGGGRDKREIHAPEQTLGFTLDTRGLLFDLSEYRELIQTDAILESAERYKEFEETTPEGVAMHTAAHFFTQFVADVAGVSPNTLFYGINADTDQVYVFERSQGGQGLVDLVFEDILNDPANALEAVTRITYNPQVVNERLWADADFVDQLSSNSHDPDSIEQLVHSSTHTPEFDYINDLVTEEVLSSIDRVDQLAQDTEHTLDECFRIKHTIAAEQVSGADSFPEELLQKEFPSLTALEKVKTLFYSPDIDGCVDNLHLSECISPHDQSDVLSYVFLETLRETILERVPSDEVVDRMFERERLPGGEFDGTSIFLTL